MVGSAPRSNMGGSRRLPSVPCGKGFTLPHRRLVRGRVAKIGTAKSALLGMDSLPITQIYMSKFAVSVHGSMLG